MLDATVAYAGMRRQFGRPIGRSRPSSTHVPTCSCRSPSAANCWALALEALATQEPQAWVEVSRPSRFLGTLAVEVSGKAMQLHGGFGYTWAASVHAYLKRAVLDRALFGSPAAHRRGWPPATGRVARQLRVSAPRQ